MIISSWNVNSVRARIENIKEYLKKYSPDILMMQEIKAQDENYPYEDFEKSNYQNFQRKFLIIRNLLFYQYFYSKVFIFITLRRQSLM